MSAERVRACAMVYGQQHWYQRDREMKDRDGKWFAQPFFTNNKAESVTMSETIGRALINKMRSWGNKDDLWLEVVGDNRRIDVVQEAPQPGEDNRTAMIASLNDVDEYIVKPICRPEGRMYFIKIQNPHFVQAGPTIVYAPDPLAVLRKAEELGILQYAEKYQRPQEPQQQPIKTGPRRRPADLRFQ